MSIRVRALAGVTLLLVCASPVFANGDDAPRRSVPVKATSDGPGLADIGPAPPVSLTDQSGRPFTTSALRGKAVLVGFVYTTCAGSCPATTFAMSRAQKALKDAGLWGTKVEFVSISLDPKRDTPAVLSNYANTFDADLNAWHFLTGPPVEVSKVVAAWGMWARVGPTGVLDHPSRVFLVDPNGRQREIYNLEFLKPEAVVRDVKTLLAEPAPLKRPAPDVRQAPVTDTPGGATHGDRSG